MQTSRILRATIAAVLVCVAAGSAYAELQNITVGGEIRVRGNYWTNNFNPGIRTGFILPQLRWPAGLVWRRPIGDVLGGQNVMSYFDWSDDGADYKLVEQRTVLSVCADFTDDVSALIEVDSFDIWGEDFRSQDYVTGVDTRPVSTDDIEFYQAYIEANEMFGYPVRMRIGRQELVFGSGWLVGNNTALPEFSALSFDGIRLTYDKDPLTVDAFWAKLAERSPVEEDGDVDFYGVYASYMGIEDMVFDGYWFWIRDPRGLEDVRGGWFLEWLEEYWNIDQYETTNLHTVGLRVAGQKACFDFEAEVAYQMGDAHQVGFLFKPGLYGDDDAYFDKWAADAEVGYTFETRWMPRVYIGGAFFDGEDRRDLTFWEWLNPLHWPDASLSFNRLFSNKVYSHILEDIGQLSNFWTLHGGIEVKPTEATRVKLHAAYFDTVETFDLPRHLRIGRFIIPIARTFTFWTQESDSELGWELSLSGAYHYTEDLVFEAGWSHLFAGDGLTDGNYVDLNGLAFTGGTDDDDADYFYFETRVTF